jgi:hypothetical protein
MTAQQEIIEFCKVNDPNFNKEASFKDLEPMWSIPKGIGGLGITESESKNGFYIRINTKERKGFEHLEGKVFYFKNLNAFSGSDDMYNSHWKKYFVPLNDIESWSIEIVKKIITGKGILEQIEPPIKYEPMSPEELKTQKTLYDSVQTLETMKPVEEFPIVKESVETMTRKNNTWLKFKKRTPEEKMTFTIFDGDEPFLFEVTKEQFSDLVDLMIEARKDLLK